MKRNRGPVRPPSVRLNIATVVFLAGILPAAIWVSMKLMFGNTPFLDESLHEGLEMAGTAIALSAAMLLMLRLRYEKAMPHLFWVVAALLIMGLIDGAHSLAHPGPGWSWLRHLATLVGGLFFGLIWFPLPRLVARWKRYFPYAVAGFALLLSAVVWIRPQWFPGPWAGDDYVLAVKVANALGGLGFLAAALFFFRRYARRPRIEELVFAGQTILFGTASLLFGFSRIWAADWWCWHGTRLTAYVIVLIAVYRFVVELYHDSARHGQEQEALARESSAALGALLDNIHDAVIATDASFNITAWNREAVALYGWTREETIGRNSREILRSKVTPEELDKLLRTLAEAGTATTEIEHSHKDGGTLFVESKLAALKDADGRITGYVVANRDITERKKALEELRANEARYRVANISLNDSRKAALNLMEDAVALRHQAEKASAELRLEIAERERVEETLRRTAGELQELTGTLERRVHERTEELEASNARLRAEIAERLRLVAAVEQAGVGIAITDASGRIHYVNPAFEKTLGSEKLELQGTSYFDLLAEEPRNAERIDKIKASARDGVPWTDRGSRKSRDGREFELDITFSPLRDASGSVSNFLAVERDVTLEVRAQQQLRQFQKIEALGTLAGGIAHDLNNILNPIFINTELALLGNDLDADTRRNLDTVLKAAERGRDLVKQIITFSRQKERERKPSKVTPVLLEALKFIRASLPSTIEIKEDLRAETGSILSDPAQIHQVVMNLVNNAAYAMRDRGGVLAVRLAEVEVDSEMTALHSDLKPGSYLRLTVTDTGTGMKPEVMERAFDPFFTTKKPGEGSGMGLAVVHGIVKDQGGSITVYSEIGKGSAFNVFFPRLMRGESVPASEAPPPEGGRERILLVDDEAVQVDSVKNMLERLGYTIKTASNGEAALEAFRKDPGFFDLVITDQTMPSITGLELAKKLLLIRPGLPIILCTGFSEIVDAGAAQRAGIRRFQMKPFSLREMAETVRLALKKDQDG